MEEFIKNFMTIVYIVGSLGMFIFGMKVLSDGLQKAAGEQMQKILNAMTGNPLTAVLTGVGVTCLLQSSSATTVMVVSVVNAGILKLTGSIGVIMGANIGTTLTGWIVALLGFKVKIATFALPAIAIGLPFLLFRNLKKSEWAEVLIGFGILFVGLSFLKENIATEETEAFMQTFISGLPSGWWSFPLFVGIGTLLTFLVQSSSAAMAITLTLVSMGSLDFSQAAMIVLGENIGTTITAFLASLGANANAKRASRVHIMFNIIGVLWMAIAFPLFIWIVEIMVPGDSANPEFAPTHLAMFHTLFNITNTLLLVWFTPQLEMLARMMVKDQKEGQYPSLQIFDAGYQDAPEAYVFEARHQIAKMMEKVLEMFHRVEGTMKKKVKATQAHEQQSEDENLINKMEEELNLFLSELGGRELSEHHHLEVSQMVRIVAQLESMGDDLFNLAILLKKRDKRKLEFEKEAREELMSYISLIRDFLNFVQERLNQPMGAHHFEVAQDFEKHVDKNRNKLTKGARNRLQDGSNVRMELIFLDVVRHLEHLGDQSLEVSRCLGNLTVA